jgi:PKD repeat protein
LINTSGDDEIQCFEAVAFNGALEMNGLGISDLTGIEAFTAITALYCSNNQLNTLNVSSNIALQTLFCESNQFTSLDVSSNTNLSYLRCSGNQLTALNVSDNTLLTDLYCLNNQITSLDLSANSNLTALNCSNNLLTSLNVKNGNNPNMTTFVAVDNPELSCIRVDDVSYSETFWTNIDPGVEFSVDCPPPAASFTSASNVCLGNSVQFNNTTTGTASSWLWEFGDGTTSTGQNPSHTYSSSSSYTVTLTAANANGSDEATKTIAVNSQPVVSLGIDVTQCGGTFTLDAGNPGSAYQWSTVATTQSITVSESGTYSVTVTGVSGCTDTDEINVTIHPEPVVSLGDDITQCAGTVTLNAGNPGFSYLWSTGATTQSITVSESENYSVTVTGINGCTTSDQVNVTIHPSLSGTLEWTDESSCGEGDGSAAITPSGGTAPYTFAWSNSGSTSSINDLTAGEYTVTITDSKGCTFTDMAVIGCVVGFEPLEDSMFQLYPNPNTGLFEISLLIPVKDHVTVHVNNPLGQLVFNEELHEFSGEYGKALDLQSLGKGVYSVRVKTNKGSMFRKVMVY